jgi:2-dehydro-3-deoxyphosphogluconate aldolase/(4S)-4-hydroxy-2-oxoglutarate aldolase
MKRSEVAARIAEVGIVPAIRVTTAEEAHFAAEAIDDGGIPIVEITLTVAEAPGLIAHLVREHPAMIVGAGGVLNDHLAHECLLAGAHFITSPGLNLKIVEFALKNDIAILPGALTPTEVASAWDAGVDFVKVFPCAGVGGDKYIKALKTSLPGIPLIAAGGVNQQTAGHYILAGATAIGVGTDIVPTRAIEYREADRIKELAQRFLGFVSEARARLAPQKEQVAHPETDFGALDRRKRPR